MRQHRTIPARIAATETHRRVCMFGAHTHDGTGLFYLVLCFCARATARENCVSALKTWLYRELLRGGIIGALV